MNSIDQEHERRWRRIIIAVAFVVLAGVAVNYGFKVADGKSAFLRWRPQVLELVRGVDIYEKYAYPNTPIVALMLSPLAALPPGVGAMLFFVLKVAMAATAVSWARRIAHGQRSDMHAWALLVLLLLSARPIISDLQHGNINILVMFVLFAGLFAFHRDKPFWAGFAIGVAAIIKVTPGLFVPYLVWKRQWLAVLGSIAGAALCVLLPTLVLGPKTNYQLHLAWYEQMIQPFIIEGGTQFAEHINQSLPGVVMRLTTEQGGVDTGQSEQPVPVNFMSLDPALAKSIVRGLSLGLLAAVAWLCRRRVTDRADWRLAAEFSMVLTAMLLLSERTWKHHFVIIALPLAVIVTHLSVGDVTRAGRWFYGGILAGFGVLTLATSGDLIGWLYKGIAHKYVEAMGSFFLGAVLLLIGTAALREQSRCSDARAGPEPPQPGG